MMDPKQASTKKSGQALGWLRQKLIPQASVPVVEVGITGSETSYRSLKVGREHFGAVHTLKGKIQSLKGILSIESYK
jgi:hypothetical protein